MRFRHSGDISISMRGKKRRCPACTASFEAVEPAVFPIRALISMFQTLRPMSVREVLPAQAASASSRCNLLLQVRQLRGFSRTFLSSQYSKLSTPRIHTWMPANFSVCCGGGACICHGTGDSSCVVHQSCRRKARSKGIQIRTSIWYTGPGNDCASTYELLRPSTQGICNWTCRKRRAAGRMNSDYESTIAPKPNLVCGSQDLVEVSAGLCNYAWV